MEENSGFSAIAYAQEIPGGHVFEIGNDWVQRRLHCLSGRLSTTSLTHGQSGEEYLEEAVSEFGLTLAGEGRRVTLESRDFSLESFSCDSDGQRAALELRLVANVEGVPLAVTLFYEARSDENCLRKWLRVEQCDLPGWVIRQVVLENLRLREMVEGVAPRQRYPKMWGNHEDDVNFEPHAVDLSDPDQRFAFGDSSRSVLTYWGYNEGLFFFMASLLGSESFHRPTGLAMRQREWVPLTDGLTTGHAVLGAYLGPPESGFRRYTEHLAESWCVVRDKPLPVIWSTWLPTLEGGVPLQTSYNRQILLDYVALMREAGFYDVLHLDLGWEAQYPLQPDGARFPNGLSEIVKKAAAAGLGMSYWVNPFSASYWKSAIEEEHPEWLVPGMVNGRSGASAICPLSGYFDAVASRFGSLVTEYNARSIYWDGSDWSIRECSSREHGHSDQEELEVRAIERFAELCESAHRQREDLLIVLFSPPFDNHRLAAVDCQQVSDTYAYPTLQSELIQRQQMYAATWEHPYRAIRGSWYGVDWHEAGSDNLRQRPLNELIFAEMSMIGNGIVQAGGGIDLRRVTPEFLSFLKKLFAFRKQFADYFDTYQHVLGFPDGVHIDGSGHVVGGSGFIVLVNPAADAQSVTVPIAEPELELPAGDSCELTDWSDLQQGLEMDVVTIDNAPTIELKPLEVKYIGVNIPD